MSLSKCRNSLKLNDFICIMQDNSYLPWSKEDIQTLDQLYQHNLTIDQLSRVLGRSPKAIEHALKNVLVQQLIHTNPRRVSSKYNITYDTMCEELTPSKYYVEDESKKGFLVVVYAMVLYMLVVTIGFMVGST